MICSEVEQRVLYAHTDKMGIVNNGRYYEYFEAGRNNMLRELGYPYTEMEKESIGLPVIESYCKYHSGAEYDDLVRIKSCLKSVPGVRIRIDYEIYRGEELVVTGYTVHAFVDSVRMKPVRPPEKLIDLIKGKFESV